MSKKSAIKPAATAVKPEAVKPKKMSKPTPEDFGPAQLMKIEGDDWLGIMRDDDGERHLFLVTKGKGKTYAVHPLEVTEAISGPSGKVLRCKTTEDAGDLIDDFLHQDDEDEDDDEDDDIYIETDDDEEDEEDDEE